MKNKNILIILGVILITVLAVLAYVLTLPKYNGEDQITSDILTAEEWQVEANGMYNYITFDLDDTFNVYVYPEVIDSGSWVFEDGGLVLNFESGIDRRMYSDFVFDDEGALHSITEGNEERWRVSENKL